MHTLRHKEKHEIYTEKRNKIVSTLCFTLHTSMKFYSCA